MLRRVVGRLTWVAAGLLTAGVALSALALDDIRVWTDVTGQHRTRAAFVGLDGDKVTLRREDGETIAVPLARLSNADQAFAKRAARGDGSRGDGSRGDGSRGDTEPKERTPRRPARSGADSAGGGLVSASVGGWPQWRGPNRDGISHETGLLDRWPEAGPPILWKAAGLGGGYASVAVVDGRLFTMGKFGGETRLVAVNVADGQTLWTTPVGGGDAPNCTPTVDGDLVFALSHGGDLLCAEAESGRELWRKNYARDFGGRMMSTWGYSESPLVDGDRVIVTPGASDATLVALDKRTGNLIWKSAMPPNPGPAGKDGAGYSSIVISEAAGVKQYIQFVGRGVIGVDAGSGRFLWGYNRIANTTANIPTPIISGDLVFCSSGYSDGGSALLRLTGSRGQVNAQEVWYKPAKELQNHHGGMILLGEHVYMGHGHNNGFPVCFHLRTGRDVWRPGRGAGSGSAAVTYADGHLYFRYENGTMALIEANPRNYQLKGRFEIAINNDKSWPHPVIADGRLYLRDQQEMLCYDIRK